MGYKAVVLFDLDVIDHMEKDPAEFVRRLQNSILSHRRTGGSVSIAGATVANVVWSGHSDLSPVLKIVDFSAENYSYFPAGDPGDADSGPVIDRKGEEVTQGCKALIAEGGHHKIEALKIYRAHFKCDLKTAMKALDYTSGSTDGSRF